MTPQTIPQADFRASYRNLHHPGLYDDQLVVRRPRSRYRAPLTNTQGDTDMNIIGRDANTPEGVLRQQLSGILAEAVGEAIKRPDSRNSKRIAQLIAEAAELNQQLSSMEDAR